MRHRRRRRRRGPLSPAQRKRQLRNRAILAGGLLMMVFLVLIIVKVAGRSQERPEGLEDLLEPDYEVNLLTPNEYSRPGIALDKVNGIVIHYTANPGSSAVANRDYFESLSISHETMASSHFIIGLDGEVVQCIPTAEISYASNDRNDDTISIECCHPDETGEFT